MADLRRRFGVNILLVAAAATVAAGDTKPDAENDSWSALGAERRDQIDRFADDYASYLTRAQTELRATTESVRRARRAGFSEWVPGTGKELREGRGVYMVNRGRAVLLARVGRRPLEDGLRIIATHIDSPRLELKARPSYAKEGFALWQTVPHGGVKYYQWVNLPLALVGHVDRMDGSRIEIEIGLDPSEPVFMIPDLAPHVDRSRRDRTSRSVVKGEESDPLVGSIKGAEGVEAEVERLLDERYDIEDDDFVSAELTLIPASPPRDVGLDRGLIAGYGQDDKLCSFAGLRALLDQTSGEYWSAVYLTDNEESGSRNNTGAKSEFIKTAIGSWLTASDRSGSFDEMRLRHTLRNTVVMSADTTTGINPMDPSVHEKGNASRVNGGVVIKRYGRGNDGNSEVLARVRKLLHDAELPWQTHTYKVDVGGGGTLGGFLSVMGMEVFDVGVPLLSMHAPVELSSKADVFVFYLFSRDFLSN